MGKDFEPVTLVQLPNSVSEVRAFVEPDSGVVVAT